MMNTANVIGKSTTKMTKFMNTADKTDDKAIAVWLQSVLGLSAINPLVTFYNIHRRKGEMLFFSSVPDITWDNHNIGKNFSQQHIRLYTLYFVSFLFENH
jgi:hypothetical protein